MIKLDGTVKEFDDFWNNKILPLYNHLKKVAFDTDTNITDYSILDKEIDETFDLLYGELDNIFINQWKHFCRSEELKDSDD